MTVSDDYQKPVLKGSMSGSSAGYYMMLRKGEEMKASL